MARRDRWVFRRGLLLVAESNNLKNDTVTPLVPVDFGQVKGNAIDQLLLAVKQMDPIAPAAIMKRFELGCQCYAAWVNDSIVAYGWVTHGSEWVGEFERQLHVKADEAYIWDCATLPEYRRMRLFSGLLSHIVNNLLQNGLQRLWIIGLVTSPELVQSVTTAGFDLIVSLTYLRLFDKHALLTCPYPGTSLQLLSAARRLLKGENEQDYGYLILGNSSPLNLPETHFDG